MKWKCYLLPDDDEKAKKKFSWSIEAIAHSDTLARKLLPRLSQASGPMFLVAQQFLDFDAIADYRWAGTYKRGKLLYDAVTTQPIPIGDQSTDGLARFVDQFITSSNDKILIVGSGHDRADLSHWHLAELRYGFLGDEAYPILTRRDAGHTEVLRDAVGIGMQWTTGLCSRIANLPSDLPLDIDLTETFLEEVVVNSVHVFTLALDDEGYLVWCIGEETDRRFLRTFVETNGRD